MTDEPPSESDHAWRVIVRLLVAALVLSLVAAFASVMALVTR